MSDNQVRVAFPTPDEDELFGTELCWCEDLGGRLFRVANVPFALVQVSVADVIQAQKHDGGILEFTRVVERGGHATARVITTRKRDAASVRKQFEAMSCRTEVGFGKMIAIDIPPSVPLDAIAGLLDEGSQKRSWATEPDALHRVRRARSGRFPMALPPSSKRKHGTIVRFLEDLDPLELFSVDMIEDGFGPKGSSYDRVSDTISYQGRSERLWARFPDEIATAWSAASIDEFLDPGVRSDALLFHPYQLSAAIFKLLFPGQPVPGDEYDGLVPSFSADVTAIREKKPEPGLGSKPRSGRPALHHQPLGYKSTRADIAGLKVRLRALGGRKFEFDWVLDEQLDAELADALLMRGTALSGAGAMLRRGETSKCHDNVERLVSSSPEYKACTGLALSDDGCWRIHSWARGPHGLIETTEPRTIYFGVDVSSEDAVPPVPLPRARTGRP